jgi:phosphatidate cytidylyltransferase
LKGLGPRVISGALLLALVLLALWLQGLLLMALVVLAAGLAAHELYTMARHAGYLPWYPAGVALAILLALRGYLGGDILTGTASARPPLTAEVMALAVVLLMALARQGYAWLRAPAHEGAHGGSLLPVRSPYLAWADLGITLGGALYTGGLLGYAPLLAALPAQPGGGGGAIWLLLVLLGTAACDTGAYFVGSAIGRHKLIPHISPGKTWEGLLGGVLGGLLAALALSGLLGLSLAQALALGLLICAAAVCGDLSESFIKRAVGVKDSGHLIPGHGGILDRVDSILFVLLAVYWFVQVVSIR